MIFRCAFAKSNRRGKWGERMRMNKFQWILSSLLISRIKSVCSGSHSLVRSLTRAVFSYSIILSVICCLEGAKYLSKMWISADGYSFYVCRTHDNNTYWLLQLCLLIIKEHLVGWKTENNMLSTASHITQHSLTHSHMIEEDANKSWKEKRESKRWTVRRRRR